MRSAASLGHSGKCKNQYSGFFGRRRGVRLRGGDDLFLDLDAGYTGVHIAITHSAVYQYFVHVSVCGVYFKLNKEINHTKKCQLCLCP